jgi:hypothetical protein
MELLRPDAQRMSHPPGEAQADYDEATVAMAGEPKKVALFVMTRAFSGAPFVQVFPWECIEIFGKVIGLLSSISAACRGGEATITRRSP